MQIKLVETNSELAGIKALQTANLNTNISADEAATQGFVSAVYTLAFLENMHAQAPSVIAMYNNEVVGYALVATKAVCMQHDLLADLVNTINLQTYQGHALANENYIVVGQLCVAKAFRGKGMVQQLYNYYKQAYSQHYTYLITDVAQANPRSLKAHQNTGFQVINTLTYGGISWDIVLWNWRQ
jgi:predicted GNAT superfamily acetyltransferase